MTDTVNIKFLGNYFSLFDAVIEDYSLTADTISGRVGWLEETDKQEFKWEITITAEAARDLSEISSFIKSKNYNHNDKIIITKEQLLKELVKYRWEKREASNLINLLLDIEVKMIDEGEETDSFFLHF